jgi:hypothetical protein
MTPLAQPGGFPGGLFEGMERGIILLALIGIAAVVLLIWWMYRRSGSRQHRPGFEVKPTTGGVPVIKKEKNNG